MFDGEKTGAPRPITYMCQDYCLEFYEACKDVTMNWPGVCLSIFCILDICNCRQVRSKPTLFPLDLLLLKRSAPPKYLLLVIHAIMVRNSRFVQLTCHILKFHSLSQLLLHHLELISCAWKPLSLLLLIQQLTALLLLSLHTMV